MNEGWSLGNSITGFFKRDCVRIYAIALNIIVVIFNNRLYLLLSSTFVGAGTNKPGLK